MSLAVQSLACARGGVRILAGVGFAVAPGAALILRGPNGSGKTTLLRTLAGLTPPLSGSIDAPPEGIAYAGHADGLKAQLSVAENLAFWARVFGATGIGAGVDAFDLADCWTARRATCRRGRNGGCRWRGFWSPGGPSGALTNPPCRWTWTTSPASPAPSGRIWRLAVAR